MICRRQREAGRGAFLTGLFSLGAGLVENQEVGEDSLDLDHAAGGAHGGVERGVGIPQGIRAGFFEAAVEIAQGPAELAHRLLPELPPRHCPHLFRWLLMPKRPAANQPVLPKDADGWENLLAPLTPAKVEQTGPAGV